MIDPHESLAQAIVIRAVTDYRKARHKLKTHPKSTSAAREAAECKRFFLSSWFTELSGLDGEMILEKLDKEEC